MNKNNNNLDKKSLIKGIDLHHIINRKFSSTSNIKGIDFIGDPDKRNLLKSDDKSSSDKSSDVKNDLTNSQRPR